MLYEKGQVVLWNLITRETERFCVDTAPVKCFSWHNNGREFLCGHKDGSITMWSVKKPRECLQKTTPHMPSENVACRPITHIHWAVNQDNEQLILFTGGNIWKYFINVHLNFKECPPMKESYQL